MRRLPLLFVLLSIPLANGCSKVPETADGSASEPTIRAFGRDGELLRYDASLGRILPTNAAALDFVAALVAPDAIVALPETAPAYSWVPVESEPWRAKPTLFDYTAEAVLALRPELVIAHAWQDPNATAILRRAGVGVVELPDAIGVEHIAHVLRFLGELLHESERAEELVSDLERRRDALLADPPARAFSALFYSNYGTGGGWTAGGGTIEDLILRLAGLRNAVAEAGFTDHPQIDIEQLLSFAPELLIVPASGEDSEMSATRGYLHGEPLMQELEAVRAGRMIILPVRLYSAASQQVLEAAEAVRAGVRAFEQQ